MKQTILYKKANKRNNDNLNYGNLNWKLDRLLMAIDKLLKRLGG